MTELREMKRGLGSGNSLLYLSENYKEYIAKVVVYDFAYETKKIKESMSRLSYDNVHLRVDDRRKDCYRNDLQRIIICEEYDVFRDEGQMG